MWSNITLTCCIAVVVGILVLVGVVRWLMYQWQLKERNKFLMIDKILGKQWTTISNTQNPTKIAEVKVQDMMNIFTMENWPFSEQNCQMTESVQPISTP